MLHAWPATTPHKLKQRPFDSYHVHLTLRFRPPSYQTFLSPNPADIRSMAFVALHPADLVPTAPIGGWSGSNAKLSSTTSLFRHHRLSGTENRNQTPQQALHHLHHPRNPLRDPDCCRQ